LQIKCLISKSQGPIQKCRYRTIMVTMMSGKIQHSNLFIKVSKNWTRYVNYFADQYELKYLVQFLHIIKKFKMYT